MRISAFLKHLMMIMMRGGGFRISFHDDGGGGGGTIGGDKLFKDIFFFSLSTITVSKDTHSAHFTSTGLEGLVF